MRWQAVAAVAGMVVVGCGTRAATAPLGVSAPAVRTVDGTTPYIATSTVGIESWGSAGTAWTGSGVVVETDARGAWVAAAKHVLVGPHAAAWIPGGLFPTKVTRIVRDPSTDLALLRLAPREMHPLAVAHLGPPPGSAWAGEVTCTLAPGWTTAKYPLTLGEPPIAHAGIDVLWTSGVDVVPGCSGAPVVLLNHEGQVVVGVLVGIRDPDGIVYVPAAEVQRLLAGVAG